MFPPGTAIGRFLIEAEVGGGGMGRVFRARDTAAGGLVALKIIRDLGARDVPRFQREARALAALSHPGIVRYVDHGFTVDGDAFLAMEWLAGEDLRARVDRGGLTVEEVVTLARRTAQALTALHGAGLVHRDIKPANLFLVDGRVDQVRLIDLGLVRAAEVTAELTKTGTALGTPAYMSPEQARGQRDIDARSDLFSLGCVLFRCLTGRTPFEGGSAMALLTKMLVDEPPRVATLRPGAPSAIDAILARLLRKSADERHQTAAELLADLDALSAADLAGDALSPLPPRVLGLTTGERRVLAMVLVAPPPSATADPGLVAKVVPLAREHQGKLDPILEGACVVTFLGVSNAADQAARAARCAIAIHSLYPAFPIAIATDWSPTEAKRPVGDAVDRAASLLATSVPVVDESEIDLERGGPRTTSIIVDSVTAALISGHFEVREKGPDKELLRALESSSGIRTLLGKPTPFVGRDWELSSVQRLFREAVEEPAARAALITAPAGMGKSRLAHELQTALCDEHPGLTTWIGRADSLRAGSSFGLIGQALQVAAGIRLNEPVARRRERLLSFVNVHVAPAEALRVAVFLGEITAAPFEGDALAQLAVARGDPSQMVEQVKSAFVELLSGATRAGPVVIVLEDVHWADHPSLRLLDACMGQLDKAPWMVLAFGRPEVHEVFPRLWHDRAPQEIRLKPLPRRAAEQLVREALGDDAERDMVARIVAQADGNAFYLEELIRAFADTNSPSDSIPGTVIAMAQARLDGLDPIIRRSLRAASIFGDVFWVRGVEELLGGGGGSSGSFVDLVSAREIVTRHVTSRFEGEEELAFRHNLLREAAYATLTPGDLALGHELAGEWLEGRGETDSMVLARHFELGEKPGRAAVHYSNSARSFLRAFELSVAIARGKRALELASSDEVRVAAATLLSEAHALAFEWAEALPHVETVLSLGRPASEHYCRALSIKITGALLLARPAEIFDALMAVLALAPEGDDIPGAAIVVAAATLVVAVMGQRDMLSALLAKVDSFASVRVGDSTLEAQHPMLRGHRLLAHLYPEIHGGGDPWAALHQAEAARASFAEIGDTFNTMFSECYAAMALTALGAHAEAERRLRAVPNKGLTMLSIAQDSALMHVLMRRAKYEEARTHIDARILAATGASGPASEMILAAARWVRGEIELRTGDPAAAEREIAAALDGGLRLVPLDLPVALAVLSTARLALGRADEALANAREAMSALSAGTTGFRHAEVHLAFVEALVAAGEEAEARQAIAAARDHLLGLAAKIEDPALKVSFFEDVRENARIMALARERLGDRGASSSLRPGG